MNKIEPTIEGDAVNSSGAAGGGRFAASVDEVVEAFRAIKAINDGGKGTFVKREHGLAFARRFFSSLHEEDLSTVAVGDLAYGARSVLEFGNTLAADETKLRVHNPGDNKPSKWGNQHTVVECVRLDAPFLTSSVLAAIEDSDLEVVLVNRFVGEVERDTDDGIITSILPESGTSAQVEVFLQIRVDRVEDPSALERLRSSIENAIADTVAVAADRLAMEEQTNDIISTLEESSPSSLPYEEVNEAVAFLSWLLRGNFIFMGMRRYEIKKRGDDIKVEPIEGNLGIMRDPEKKILRRGDALVEITPEVKEFLQQPTPLIISKASVRSQVNRRVHLDYIGVKTYDDLGAVSGEIRIVGLFTARVYFASAERVPVLRKKVFDVLNHPSVPPGAYARRSLQNILEIYPRDDMFQLDGEELVRICLSVLRLRERPRTRVFARRDKFNRFVSVVVFLPRKHFNTDLVDKVGEILASTYEGHVSLATPSAPEGSLVLLHYIIGHHGGAIPQVEEAYFEPRIEQLCENWSDRFAECVAEQWSDGEGKILASRYANAFSPAYESTFSPQEAVEDVQYLQTISEAEPVAVRMKILPSDKGEKSVHIKLYSLKDPIPLATRLPVLDSLGIFAVSERTYEISTEAEAAAAASIWLHDITIAANQDEVAVLASCEDALTDAFISIWNGWNRNDGYNRLILSAGMVWQQVLVFRAIGHYLHQIGLPFTKNYVCRVLQENSLIVSALVELFQIRFGDDEDEAAASRTQKMEGINQRVEEQLEKIDSLDDDRILRSFRDVIQSTLRTNVYQIEEGELREGRAIAFKIDSRALEMVPEPRPYREIFVMAPTVEGIHLRGGPVARGGIRWSDRPQDYRTEVLGLVKAQQVKNSVIVPVGAKGGFVPQRLPSSGDREDVQRAGVEAYKRFISALLDVTDNVRSGEVVPPPAVMRHDGDDPYLVVAADKGTATFSDIANEISQSRSFWLDDAFASGGSAGYDHKAMGITARGAWEAVKRHFREVNTNIQEADFTAVGVGDMSGDVFGNGMLLSPHTKLVAAFNHQHIFLDPSPDPAASLGERKRLFAMERSSWLQYDASLISAGGGIYSRTDKAIELSDEVKQLTGLSDASVTPNELIRALLRSQVDLLWFGGIGTYIRSSRETDADAGDRTNDAVRVSAREVKARVIGEGANLGVTQRGRIEFAQLGGRCNTDFIDNAAGVNTSDIEVNIKIALAAEEQASRLGREERDGLLAAMTDDVAALVLRSNYDQTLALTLLEREALALRDNLARYTRYLEKQGLLNRAIEFLPDDTELAQREEDGETFTRPELAVILAYAKNILQEELLGTSLPDEPYFQSRLLDYFPAAVVERARGSIEGHKLRREIIATTLANQSAYWLGPDFLWRLVSEGGFSLERAVSAFVAAYDGFSVDELLSAIDEQDNLLPSDAQLELHEHVRRFLRRITSWYCRTPLAEKGELEKVVTLLSANVKQLLAIMEQENSRAETSSAREKARRFTSQGVPKELAASIASLDALTLVPDIIAISQGSGVALDAVASIHLNLARQLHISWLADHIRPEKTRDYFEQMGLARASVSLYQTLSRLTQGVIASGDAGKDSFAGWQRKMHDPLAGVVDMVEDAQAHRELSFARLTVILSRMQDVADEAGQSLR